MRINSYDALSGTLDVAFEDGTRPEFFDIPVKLFEAMQHSESPLNHFHAHIWNKGFEHRTHWRSLNDLLEFMEEQMCFDVPASVCSVRSDADTPLHVACVWGDLEAVDLLLTGGADRNARGDLGCTPLFNAVSFNHARCVERLLAAGATSDDTNELGRTARERALASNNPRLLALLANKV